MATDIIARGMAAGVVSQVLADRQAVSEDREVVEAAKTEVLNVAESIPEDYSTLSADVSELKSDLVTLDNVLSTYNLLKTSYAQSEVQYGVTITNNGDGTFTTNGTCSGGYVNYSVGSFTPKVTGTYRLSGVPTGSNVNNYYMFVWNSTDRVNMGMSYTNGQTYTLEANKKYKFAIQIKNVTVSNLVWKPMLVVGNETKEFVQYYCIDGMQKEIASLKDFSNKSKSNIGINPAPKQYENVEYSIVNGGMSISNNVISENSSNAWTHIIVDVNVDEVYLIKTRQALRSATSNGYIVFADNNGNVKAQYLDSNVAEPTMSKLAFITVPSGATKMWVLCYGNIEEYPEFTVVSVSNVFDGYYEAIFSLSEKIKNKVDAIDGKGLSTNDFTDYYKSLVESGSSESTIISAVNAWLDAHPSISTTSPQLRSTDVTVTVGSNGDYSTIGGAIEELSKFHKVMNVNATVMLLSGFVMNEQVVVDSNDLGWITIVSEDTEVSVNSSALQQQTVFVPQHGVGVAVGIYSAFTARNNATLPNIGCLFNMGRTSTAKTGIAVYNSKATILDGCGFKGANVNLYLIERAEVNAMGAIFSNALATGIHVFRTSSFTFWNGDATGCDKGIYIDSNSNAELSGANFSGSASIGVQVGMACNVAIGGVNCDDSGIGILVEDGGRISGRDVSAQYCIHYALKIKGCARADLVAVHFEYCKGDGGLNAEEYSGTGIFVTTGGTGSITGGSTHASRYGVVCRNGFLSLPKFWARKNTDVDSNSDFVVEEGGVIYAIQGTGGTSITPNVVNTNGVIFK